MDELIRHGKNQYGKSNNHIRIVEIVNKYVWPSNLAVFFLSRGGVQSISGLENAKELYREQIEMWLTA